MQDALLLPSDAASSKRAIPGRRIRTFATLALLLSAVGCSRPVASQDEQELRHPKIRAALALEKSGDEAGAIRLYEEALAGAPTLARAHLNLAFLLEKPERDPLMAVFHYKQYLALRPHTEKKAIIEDRIRAARLAAAAAMLPSDHLSKRLEAVMEENRLLKAANSNLMAQIEGTRSEAIGEPRTAPSVSADGLSSMVLPAPPLAPIQRIHTVRTGDTLSGIAAQHYGDSRRWRDIVAANSGTLRNPSDIKVGQTLIIP